MHDPLDLHDLVSDELRQRRESGYAIDLTEDQLGTRDLASLYAELVATTPTAGWPYDEPSDLATILERLPTRSTADDPPRAADPDRVLGGWLGRIAGCNLGKPIENGDHWTPERIRSYLELSGAYPLRDYVPVLDPMPEDYRLLDCWTETTRGRIDGSARDDDIDYAILAVHLLEQHGRSLTPDHTAEAWLGHLPYLRVYTAERAVYAGLLQGVPVADVADTRNPYREWIGALIRADAYGWVLPGRPRAAATLAYADASLSHRANGIYGAMWAAALVASAGRADSVDQVVDEALTCVPARTRLHEALVGVRELHRGGAAWDDALDDIRRRHGHYSWVHTVNNACLIAAGLLWGDGDFAASVGLTVQGGWDTDSNGATAGSVAGTLIGAARLPERFVQPLHDRTRSALFGYDNSRISDLALRTLRLSEVFAEAEQTAC